jgi:uncharacterized protein YciI
MRWFVKLEAGLVPKPQFDAVIPAHLAWLADLERKGHAPRSGYWADRVGRSGEGAGGMLVFCARDWAEAELLVQSDPLILEGCVDWTLHESAVVFPRPLLPSCETAAPGPS